MVILGYPGIQSLDLTGPLEVFAAAQQLISQAGVGDRGYRISVLSHNGEPFASASGLSIAADGPIGAIAGGVDTLIVPGGLGWAQAVDDRVLIDWICATASKARRVASVCTGAFLLAEAGLLDGRRATTHWSAAAELARRHPRVRVDPDPIFVRDGAFWTSAGVTAGMDLALALVEEDLDRQAALTIARHLVLFLRRPGNQSQFSAALAAQEPRREPLREAQRFAIEQPAADLSIEGMAARANMSTRHFARCFHAETGMTPARYVERIRVEAARRQLEESADSLATVATDCGFGSPDTMRRAFLRATGVGPADYRRRFRGGALSSEEAA